MIPLLDFVAFAIYIISFSILVFKYIQLKKSKEVLFSILVQTEVEKRIFADKLAKELEIKDSQNIENTEGFLNFVSQSRDWAYKYIEDVQAKLKEVFSVVDSLEKKTPKTILAELNKLKTFLPEDKENK